MFILSLKNTRSPITNPYSPCVPGNNCNTNDLPNFSGSSAISPAATSPTIPTPFADPIPDKNTATAAPKVANKTPPYCANNVDIFIFFLLKII